VTDTPIALVLGFIECINRGDVDALAALMTDDHRLVVLDEKPVVGRDANVTAWRGYTEAFPDYVIHVSQIAGDGNRVAVLGTTTGSHLQLPDDEERRLTVIWVAEVVDDALARWQIVADTASARAELGLDDPPPM
jgi:ketosteroid isomerase-like protein